MFGFRPYRRGRSPLPWGSVIYRAARADARQEVPYGSEPAEWVQGLHRACAGWAERLAASWCRADRALLTRRLSLQAALHHASMELEKTHSFEMRIESEQAAREQVQHDRQNPMAGSLSTGGYLVAMLLLISLELPLVYMSFSTFELDPINTALLSLLSAGITGFLGHSVGTVSRHMQVGARAMLAILLGFCLLFAASLGWLRESALEAVRSEHLTLNPAAGALALFAISLCSLVAASLLAWHHGEEPGDRALHRARRHRRRWERRVERLRHRLGQADTGRRTLREMARQDIRAMEQAMLGAFHRYARWNQLHRDKHDLPACLLDANLPRLPMPALLEQPLSAE